MTPPTPDNGGRGATAVRAAPRPVRPVSGGRRRGGDLRWYRNAIIYELHVRAFHDSDADGVGDFRGLTEKLDYLQELGITAIWLLPFYPSPLRDDGYDIADYTSVNPAYGTMGDVRRFVREAHARGIRVITELVLNHTSDQHQWFQRARRAAPDSSHRRFYVWSDTPERYEGVRIIFQDFESSNWTWDPVAKAYYWHRFYSHQPDLNFENPAVQEAMLRVVDHWFDQGIDGMRLDAVPYLYEREGTNCENLPETHAFLKKLRAHVESKHPDRMFLAEANQWPEDAIAYFGDGDECHMNFHFPLMPRLFMALQMEDRFPIIDILEQTPPIPESCQWATFLRNHDELTLEMVTEEERDYMYRVYAGDRQARINLGIRRRLAPLLQNNRRRIELMSGLLFSLPGSPVLYYGDEIGMGDNIYLGDRDGVRTPMQWSADRNAGFSRANPQQLYLPVTIDPEYHYEAINVEAQHRNSSSLLWWMKRLIAQRKRHPVLAAGPIEFLQPENGRVLAFVRRDEHETMLVVANLSRFVQGVELELEAFSGLVPVEVFGATPFPRIGDAPYFITLSPHGFYWFSLERSAEDRRRFGRPADAPPEATPAIDVGGAPTAWLESDAAVATLEPLLADDMPRRRWFRGKSRKVRRISIDDRIPLRLDGAEPGLAAVLALVRVEYLDAESETYAVPLAVAGGVHAGQVLARSPRAAIARLRLDESTEDGWLYDAMADPAVCAALLELARKRRRTRGRHGTLRASLAPAGRAVLGDGPPPEPHVPRFEQSNSSVIYGDRLVLKLYRGVAPGVNPDLEISRHLTDRGFAATPAYAGAIEYRSERGEPATLALLQQFVANEGDGWQYTLDVLDRFYESVLAMPREPAFDAPPVPAAPLVELTGLEPPSAVLDFFGHYLETMELLGRRTAEMHAALADDDGGAETAFTPEPLSQLSRRSLYQGLRNAVRRSMRMLERARGDLPAAARADAAAVLEAEGAIMERIAEVRRRPIEGMRTRCHGDYHLGQVLMTGRDVSIIDFEGEPARPLSERRIKTTPLRDVAGMLRSFQYAAHAALRRHVERGGIDAEGEGRARLEPWAGAWRAWSSAAYLRSYRDTLAGLDDRLLPEDDDQLGALLHAWLLAKATYEVRYELDNRPDWIDIPLRGLLELIEVGAAGS